MAIRIKVAVIDDDKSVRAALARLIKSAGIEPSTYSSAKEFLADPGHEKIDCALTDVRMPGLNGLELQKHLHITDPHISVVFITGHGDIPMSVEAMKEGAVDFLEKPVDNEALLAAIRRAAERSQATRASRDELNELKRRYELLTPRERQVFALVTAGFLNKQIGFDLGTAEKTVKAHRAKVMEKMKAGSLANLVLMAQALGLQPLMGKPSNVRPQDSYRQLSV